MIEIREGIIIDDLRNYLQRKEMLAFFRVLKFKRAKAAVKRWKEQRLFKFRSAFVSNLRIVPKIVRLNEGYLRSLFK